MSSSTHCFSKGISFEELNHFIDPIKVNINIPFSILEGLTYESARGKIRILSNRLYDKVLENVPSLKARLNNSKLFADYIFSVTYTSHLNGYDFRFSPIDFVNNVFAYLNVDYKIPFINLDTPDGLDYFKDYVRACVKDYNRISEPTFKTAILDELIANLDEINMYYFKPFDNFLKNKIIPKDVLFYIAYRSLDLYEKTLDEKYMVFAYEYYKNVSDMTTSPYPHMIRLHRNGQKLWYNDFRTEFENNIGPRYTLDPKTYALTDHEVLIGWDIMSPGMVDRELRDVMELARANPNVDYDKYQKLFEMKMNFYMSSPYIKYIVGKYGLTGYVGFSYPNEYLLFDKFHNSDTIDLAKRTILTHEEAIFALPADRFSVVRGSKQDVIKAKETDSRIKKYNHTINGSFLGRLDKVVNGPNVSTEAFEDVIKKEQQRVLIRR